MSADNSFFAQFKSVAKTIVTIVSWIVFGLLVLIIAFLVYYLIATNLYAVKGESYEPKFSLYTIVSPSMEPKINVYDVVVNTRVDNPKEIKKGDVITFVSTSSISNGMTVTHRVTDVVKGPDGLEFKTKGDNNLTEDTATAKERDLLGKVVLRLPQVGRLQFFIASSGGWLIVVLIPALFIIINDIFKIIKLNSTKKTLNKLNEEPDDTEKKKKEKERKEELKTKLKEDSNKLEMPKKVEETEDGIPTFLIDDKKGEEKKNNEKEEIKESKEPEETIDEKLEKTTEIKLPKYLEEPRKEIEKPIKEEIEEEPKEEMKNVESPKQDKLDNVILNMIDESNEEKAKENKNKNNIFDDEKKEDIFSDSEDDIFIPSKD